MRGEPGVQATQIVTVSSCNMPHLVKVVLVPAQGNGKGLQQQQGHCVHLHVYKG